MALITQQHQQNNVLFKTLLLSLLLHATGIYFIPKIDFTPEQPPKILTVELAPPAPKSPATPTPPQPEPVKPQPQKPQPIKTPSIKAPSPITEKSPEPQPANEPPPNIITSTSKPETPAQVTVPVKAEPPPPPPPAQAAVDYDALSSQYARLISREVAKYKEYPNIALMRNWQGEAMIEVVISGAGKVLESKVHTSSGYDVLDKQALKMVNKGPLPLPPEALRNRPITILIPISFKIE